MSTSSASDDTLRAQLQQAVCDSPQPRQSCRDLVEELLTRDPEGLAREARWFLSLAWPASGEHPADETADLMMEANPRLFEATVAGAAEACSAPQTRFRLTRAVFRRFPGRYRQRMLEVGREVLASGEVPPEVAVWLVRKFGAELVPDLVGYVRCPGSGAERLDVLHEAVKVLGLGADPVLQAALGSGCEELEAAAREALRRMGAQLPEETGSPNP
jgi:hypothetical protein